MNQLSTFPAHSIVRKLVDTIWIIVLIFVLVPNAMAQDERVEAMNFLKKMDVNQNEILEPGEINGRAKGFLKNLGFDTDRPIPIKRILRKLGKLKDKEAEKDKTPATNSSTRVTKVPSFGPSDGGRPVAGFGLSDVKPATTRYSESVLQQVEETLGNYDLNKDRILDRSEIKRAPWGKPEPSKSDTNSDGKLTYTELANRYFAREQFSREAEKSNRERKRQATPVALSRKNSDRSSRNNRSSTRGQVTRDRNKPKSQFQQRNSAANNTSSEARQKYAAYAKSLIKNYDKDGDGNLSQAEVKSMRRPPVGADGDGNGYVTETELVDSLSGVSRSKAVATKSQNPKSNSNSSSNNRSTNSGTRTKTVRASGSFSGLDKNGDNQVEMHEFASEWDDQKAADFFKKDKNRDGVITSREWNSQ